MRKLLISIILTQIVFQFLHSQHIDIVKKSLLNLSNDAGNYNTDFNPQLAVGTGTGIYGYWDLQSNGGAVNYIEMNPTNPENVHVVMMIATDSSSGTALSTSRRVAYNFSYDGGNSWGVPKIVPSIRAGYPSLTLYQYPNNTFSTAIASHGSPSIGSPIQSSLYIENSEGENNFTTYLPPLHLPGSNDVIWPIITQTSNGSVILAGSFSASSSLSGLSVIKLDSNRVWGSWNRFETNSTHAGRIAIAAGDAGRAAVIWRANTNPDSLIYRETTNNGNNWGVKKLVLSENGSRGPCWTGFDAMYIGTTLYITYTQSNYDEQGYKVANQVMLWKSSTQNSTVVIDSFYFPKLMKTVLMGKNQTNHNFAFNFPSIGKNTNNTRIYIAVDAFLQGVTDHEGYNYSDILLTYSDDDGNNWKIPTNITNTNTLDERYVSISTINPILNSNGNDSNWVYLVYQEDIIPGANYVTTGNEPGQDPFREVY